MSDDKRGAFVQFIAHMRKSATARLDAFRAALDKSPTSALEASEDAFEGAARLAVIEIVAHRIQKGHDLAAIVATATREALRDAKYPKRSTSPTSCLMHQCMGAAWAEVATWNGDAS